MSFEELRPRVEFVGNRPDHSRPPPTGSRRAWSPPSATSGTSSCMPGFGQFAPAYQCATTYRALRQPSLNRLLQSLRERSGCLFFERRFDAQALKAFMNRPGVILGFLSDQSAAATVRVPFLGHDCSTTSRARHFRAALPLRFDHGHLLSRRPGPVAHRGRRGHSDAREWPGPLRSRHHGRREPGVRSRRPPRPGQLVLGA